VTKTNGNPGEADLQDDAAETDAPAEQAAAPPIDGGAEARAERDRLKDQLLRIAADFDNFRKRTKRDLDDAYRRGKEDVVRELLPVFDNLERAVAAAESAKDIDAMLEGVRMVLKLFEDGAARFGLTRIPSVGQRFDPNVHDAIQQIETADKEPGTILAELVPGYRLGDRLVRAAMVVVARPPAKTST